MLVLDPKAVGWRLFCSDNLVAGFSIHFSGQRSAVEDFDDERKRVFVNV